MNLGFGLGVIPVLGVFLNLMKIQLFWPIFLVLSLIIPIYSICTFIKSGKKFDFKEIFKLKKSTLFIICALFLALAVFVVFHKGAFTYPYLEDDDPWFHAVNAQHLSEFRSFSRTIQFATSYNEPYPQGYIILMGILHQTNTEIIWNLKFFNALIISLSVLFFYFFALNLLDSRKKALFATFCLAIIPCFLSHFIWASSLVITLFFPALYAIDKARVKSSTSWMIVGAIVVASMLVTQPSNGFIFGILFFFYWLFYAITNKRFLWKVLMVGIFGVMLAVSLFWIPMLLKYGLIDTAAASTINLQGGLKSGLESMRTIGSGGEAVYSLTDFMIARTSSKMDNPTGVGVFLFWLAVWSFFIVIYQMIKASKGLFSPESSWKIMAVFWSLVAVAGINGNRLPFPMLMPHRWWAILAIPLALICAEGFFALGNLSERLKIHKFFVYAAIILGVLITSGYPKYVVETSYWPPGVNWGSMDEVQGYLSYVKPLPYGTKVFPICSPEFKVLAFDKMAEPWDGSYADFKKDVFRLPLESIHRGLKSRGYEYLIIDSYCVVKEGLNQTNTFLFGLQNSPKFSYVNGNAGMYVFKVI
jgi:hypothetical protein